MIFHPIVRQRWQLKLRIAPQTKANIGSIMMNCTIILAEKTQVG